MHRLKTGMFAVTFLLVGIICRSSVSAEFAYEKNVRNIDLKDMKVTYIAGGKQHQPTIFTSAEALAKDEGLKDAADAIEKKVDFREEKLVYFRWEGSKGDGIAADLSRFGSFWISEGLTRAYGFHVHLFAVPKDAEVKVVYKK